MEQAEGIHNQDIAPIDTPPKPAGVAEEKVLKQSEVNEIINRVKHEAYEKGLRHAQGKTEQVVTPPPQMGGIPQVTEDHVRQMIADEAQKQAQMAQVHHTLSNFAQQMGAGKGKYSDFDETVANLGNLQTIPHIVKLATDTGIAGDVMYELGRNPGKVASLTTLAYINPHLAEAEMKKLSDSIRANQEATRSPSVAEPLSQIRPSPVGTDNGSNSVRDLRRKPWARN